MLTLAAPAVSTFLCYFVIMLRKVICIVSRWPSLAVWVGFPPPQLAQIDFFVLTNNQPTNFSDWALCWCFVLTLLIYFHLLKRHMVQCNEVIINTVFKCTVSPWDLPWFDFLILLKWMRRSQQQLHGKLSVLLLTYVDRYYDTVGIRKSKLIKMTTVNSLKTCVQGMTLNCIHIFIVTGSFLYWCVMRLASQRLFLHSCIYLRILIIAYLATFLDTNSLSVLMCCKAVNQSINQSIHV